LRARINLQKQVERHKQPKIDIGKLKNEEILNKYRKEINKKLPNNRLEDTARIEEQWNHLKMQILEKSNDIFGPEPTKERREWFDKECKATIEDRNKAHQEYLERPTHQKQEMYKEKRQETDKLCWRKKRAALNSYLLQTDKNFKKNNISDAFKCVKNLRKVLKLLLYFVGIQRGIC
jgi:recombinational DNA repair ATPase RecF